MFDVLLFHQCISQKNAIMYLLEIDSAQGFWHLLVTVRDQRALSRTMYYIIKSQIITIVSAPYLIFCCRGPKSATPAEDQTHVISMGS